MLSKTGIRSSRQANNQVELDKARVRLAYNARGYHARRSYHSWRCHDNVQLSFTE